MPSGVAIGTLIGVCFACAWAIAGLQGIPTRWRGFVLAIAVLVSVLIGIGVIWRLRSAPASSSIGKFDGAVYGWTVAFESIAIILTVIALRRGGRVVYIMPAIALIVGAHFFGLAYAMVGAGRIFVWVGSAMCLLAVAVMYGLARSFLSSDQGMAVTGFGCAAILWMSTVFPLI
jgi:hypothetical protein